jgi:hypothetical protein
MAWRVVGQTSHVWIVAAVVSGALLGDFGGPGLKRQPARKIRADISRERRPADFSTAAKPVDSRVARVAQRHVPET